ncbi:MAG: hypothetical protein OXQ27_02670, partial [Chloroflexota bacterium]|nr:hypothetical protein [Chloroflexota bacterium]
WQLQSSVKKALSQQLLIPEFDALDPETGRTIGKREAAEARAEAERHARLEAEAELARLRAQLRGQG